MWGVFVALVGYFPHIRRLEIGNSSLLVDDRPIPELPHTLRGRLVTHNGGCGALR